MEKDNKENICVVDPLSTDDASDVRLKDAQNAVCTSVNFRPVLLLIIQQAPICA